MNKSKHTRLLILFGALLLLAGLLFMLEPYYTWAQEQQENNHPCRVALEPDESLFELENMNPGDETTRTVTVVKTGTSSANLYMTWDFISGDPTIGQEGSLFEHLILVISHEGEELYRGPMISGPQAGAPSQLTDALYITFMEHGDELELDFTVILPGPETGNVFQGSNVVTKLVFYTICDDEPDTTPDINIEKFTNGVDADVPTGPFILIGDPVTWTYVVTNPGRVPLSNVEVTDNITGVNPVYVSGDTNEDGILQVGETWIFEATGVAEAGQYANIGSVVGTPPEGEDVTDDDPSHYFGVPPDQTVINIEKATNGFDADLPTGPSIPVGNTVTWTYVVTNPNTIPLYDIVVTDNRNGVTPVYISGDVNDDNILQPTEVWTFSATGIAVSGQYSNIGSVSGISESGKVVTDTDPSHYVGVTGIIIDPEDPGVEPEDPDEDEDEDDDSSTIIIIRPERPTQTPVPRTDGATLGFLIGGFTILLIGLTLKRRELESN